MSKGPPLDPAVNVPYIRTDMAEKTTRLEARLTPEQRAQIDHAAALAGEPVSTFVIAAAIERAAAVVDRTATTVIPAAYFDELLATIDSPDEAPRLSRAAKAAEGRGRIGPP